MSHPDLSLMMLLVGMVLGAQKSARNELVDPPLLPIAADVETAIHAIKSILINHGYDGSRWRLIQIDTGIGQLVACLDYMEAQRDGLTKEMLIVRTQLMLLTEFKAEGQRTFARLNWRVHSRIRTDTCHQVIAETTNLIRAQLATEFPPAP